VPEPGQRLFQEGVGQQHWRIERLRRHLRLGAWEGSRVAGSGVCH
jgi:hypothetical protein